MTEENSIPHITCEHLQKIKQEQGPDHTIIDLRDPLEYDAGHIENSHNIPRKELGNNIENVVPHKSHRVVVIVGATHESEIERIYEELREKGYESIEFLSGGFDRWCEISPPEVEEGLSEATPEELGVGVTEGEAGETDYYEGEDPEEESVPLM